jgi:DNA-binding LacI/PurR family transcriptional regulator
VWSASGELDAEQRALDECRSQMTDGLIVVHPSAHLSGEGLRPVVDAGVPVVTLAALPGIELDCVTVDRRHGAYLAVRHLLDLGHRRLGFLHGDLRYDTDRERPVGLREAYAELGLEPDLSLWEEAAAGFRGGYEAAQRLLARSPGMTALFCNNDEVAVGAMRALREAGLQVPDDVAMVGFDDIEIAEFAPAPLTTVSQPITEQARLAVERLFARLDGAGRDLAPETISLQPALVIRDSCGARKVRDA